MWWLERMVFSLLQYSSSSPAWRLLAMSRTGCRPAGGLSRSSSARLRHRSRAGPAARWSGVIRDQTLMTTISAMKMRGDDQPFGPLDDGDGEGVDEDRR